jgi:hypothetical protein
VEDKNMKIKIKRILYLALIVIMAISVMPATYAKSNDYETGDIIQFGTYPQSQVKDTSTIDALNNLTPAWSKWISYNYYSGDDSYGSMKAGDWMRYTDVSYNGDTYRAIRFTQYRHNLTYASKSDAEQRINGYETDTVYWFKFEPINWRVLNPDTGLVMCETIIDAQPYSNTIYVKEIESSVYRYYNDAACTTFSSDYETSSIRTWLNDDFYHTAFTEAEKRQIAETTLDNNGYYSSVKEDGYEELDSASTNDKIFLLSYKEAKTVEYGFHTRPAYQDAARTAYSSDYAKSQGLSVLNDSKYASYNGTSCWLLRSPGHNSHTSCYVYYQGGSDRYFETSNASAGIRPAFNFNDLINIAPTGHIHNYTSAVTPSTCTVKGYTTYTCECSYSYVMYNIELLKHTDADSNYECDYGCGYEFEMPESEEPAEPEVPEDSEETEEPTTLSNILTIIKSLFKSIFSKIFGWMIKK